MTKLTGCFKKRKNKVNKCYRTLSLPVEGNENNDNQPCGSRRCGGGAPPSASKRKLQTSILDNAIHFKPLQGSHSNITKVKIPRRFKKIRNEVSTRMGPEEVSLCVSVEDVVYPKTAQNKDGQWLFVVNHDQYIQGVRVEKCVKEGRCTLTDGFPLGYSTSCKQKYIYRKLLALGENGQTLSDSFRLPSCCSCIVTKGPGAPEIS